MPSKYKALNDASRLAHAQLTGGSPNPEDVHAIDCDMDEDCRCGVATREWVRLVDMTAIELRRLAELCVEDEREGALIAGRACAACGQPPDVSPASGEELPIVRGALDAQEKAEREVFRLRARCAELTTALRLLRCEVSGNPCNTDCRIVGRPPCCETCRYHHAATQEEDQG